MDKEMVMRFFCLLAKLTHAGHCFIAYVPMSGMALKSEPMLAGEERVRMCREELAVGSC
jgi:hypothetical protein